MDEWFERFTTYIFSQCGITTAVLFMICLYLAYSLNSERKEREDDRRAWREDNAWRVTTAANMTQTLGEIDRGLKSLLEIKAILLQSVKATLTKKPRVRR